MMDPAHGAIGTDDADSRDVQNNIAASQFGTFYNSADRSVRLKFELVKY